jgi:hypothetical protein
MMTVLMAPQQLQLLLVEIRTLAGLITARLTDSHSIIESGWNGFPAYEGNSAGEQIASVPYAVVPNLVGLTLAAATDALKDAGLVLGTVSEANNAAGATALNDGKIKTQATAAGANSIALGTAVNVTKYVYTA